jgi:hypothetical protein
VVPQPQPQPREPPWSVTPSRGVKGAEHLVADAVSCVRSWAGLERASSPGRCSTPGDCGSAASHISTGIARLASYLQRRLANVQNSPAWRPSVRQRGRFRRRRLVGRTAAHRRRDALSADFRHPRASAHRAAQRRAGLACGCAARPPHGMDGPPRCSQGHPACTGRRAPADRPAPGAHPPRGHHGGLCAQLGAPEVLRGGRAAPEQPADLRHLLGGGGEPVPGGPALRAHGAPRGPRRGPARHAGRLRAAAVGARPARRAGGRGPRHHVLRGPHPGILLLAPAPAHRPGRRRRGAPRGVPAAGHGRRSQPGGHGHAGHDGGRHRLPRVDCAHA